VGHQKCQGHERLPHTDQYFSEEFIVTKTYDISAVSRLERNNQGIDGRFSAGESDFSPLHSVQIPPSLLSNGYRGLFPGS
jgi:hypothetical protein